MNMEVFKISITDDVLADLRHRLELVRWPSQLEAIGWEQGTERHFLQKLTDYWLNDYDWRKQEALLNQFQQYKTTIDGLSIHFVYEKGQTSRRIPLILTHGWPDSYLRYQKMIPLLTNPRRYGIDSDLSFDIIVPSMPGFGFSEVPKQAGFNNASVADLWVKLMTETLGYEKFVASGGDMGSGVTRYLAAKYSEQLLGIHLTDVGLIQALIQKSGSQIENKSEQTYVETVSKWLRDEAGYMAIQSTKPQTLAYGLSDSPVGLAGWLLEKYCSWSDCDGDLRKRFSNDEFLTHVMIYWVTNTIASSIRMYDANSHTLPKLGTITIPTAISLFSADINLPPKAWVERAFNVQQWSVNPKGGHFTAFEEPEWFSKELFRFAKTL